MGENRLRILARHVAVSVSNASFAAEQQENQTLSGRPIGGVPMLTDHGVQWQCMHGIGMKGRVHDQSRPKRRQWVRVTAYSARASRESRYGVSGSRCRASWAVAT